MKKQILFLIITLSTSTLVLSQVKIGGTGTPHVNSVLELDGGTDKGLLLPRLTNAQMINMSAAPDGMIIFNTTDQFMYCRKNGTWEKMENGGGITLPHESTHSLTNDYVLQLTNDGSGGAAILGMSNHSAGGVFGYSEDGIATLGNSINGTGGYFSSINGQAVYADGEVGIGTVTPFAPLSFLDTVGRKISFYGTQNQYHGIGVQSSLLQIHADQPSSSIAFGTGSSNSFTERMRITGQGKVGIGNFAPQAPLSFSNLEGNKILLKGDTISGYGLGVKNNTMRLHTATSATDIAFGHGTNNSFAELMRIKGNGQVSIGSWFPLAQLHCATPNDMLMILENENALNSDVSSRLFFKSGDRFTGAIATTGTSPTEAKLGFFTFAAAGPYALAERMTILNNGNIGISNPNPTSKLHILGKTQIQKWAQEDAALVVTGKSTFQAQTATEPAIEINGGIKVGGPAPAAFIVTASDPYSIPISHPSCDGNPNAIILVTPRSTNLSIGYHGTSIVEYNTSSGQWSIHPTGLRATGYYADKELKTCDNDCTYPIDLYVFEANSFATGDKFNVLVISN
jgi:hypothetical protein